MASLEFAWLEGPFMAPASDAGVTASFQRCVLPASVQAQWPSKEAQRHLGGRLESFAEWPGIPPLAEMAIIHTELAVDIQSEGAK